MKFRISRTGGTPAIGFALALSWLVCGCQWAPTFGAKRANQDLTTLVSWTPDNWQADRASSAAIATNWLKDFRSPELNAYVAEALAANPDLKAAGARVAQARAELGRATGALLPEVGGSGFGSRAQRPGDQRFPGLGQRANRFNTSVDVSWDFDIWGQLADERRASASRAFAVVQDYQAASLSLAANTARAVLTLAQADLQLALSKANVEVRNTQLRFLNTMLERGLDAERVALDVSLARADLARAEAEVELRRRGQDLARRSLEILLGRYPAGSESGLGGLPVLKRPAPAGLPAELLGRRPDVRALEDRVWASLQAESAARKALLPGIRFSGDKGFSAQELNQIGNIESAVWTVASQVTQPIFQGGRLRAGIRLSKARYDEALQLYVGGVLGAFQEVETALAAGNFLVAEQKALQNAAVEAERAEQLALQQYERGFVDVLTLLDARQRAFEARRALLAAEAATLLNRVDLHLALGGDF